MSTKTSAVEYRLLVQPAYDETLKKHGYLFLLETSKIFTNFSYVIDVRDVLEGNGLLWTLHGLRAPSMIMPATGSATFRKIYFDLPRTVRFTLLKSGTTKASAEIVFGKNGITATSESSTFLKVYTNAAEFDEKRTEDAGISAPKPEIRREPPAKKKPATQRTRT